MATAPPRPGTSSDARPPIHFPRRKDSTNGLMTPRTSLLPWSMFLNTIHLPVRMERVRMPSFHSNVPGRVGDDAYDPSRARGSREVTAGYSVMMWFVEPGKGWWARWERKRDLPEEGAEVRSVGSRRERWMAIDWRALIIVGVVIRGAVTSGCRVYDRRSKMPWTFATRGLENICQDTRHCKQEMSTP